MPAADRRDCMATDKTQDFTDNAMLDLFRAEVEKYRKIVKMANIRVD